MKIGFFGTYFYNYEKIILNSLRYDTVSYVTYFTDKGTNKKHFDEKENLSILTPVDLDANADAIKFTSDKINSYFECDFDRMTEFRLPLPSRCDLTLTAGLIIDGFNHWYECEKPEILICEGPHNFFTRVIIDFLQKNDLKYYTFRSGRVSKSTYLERSGVHINSSSLSWIQNTEKDYMSNSHPNHRGVIQKIMNFTDTSLCRDLKTIWPLKTAILEDKQFSYSGKRISLLIKTRLLYIRKEIIGVVLKLLLGSQDIKVQNYLIYPEQYRPEASTSAYDFDLIDDIKNCQMIEELLNDYPLVFRFHPSYFSKRAFKKLFSIIYKYYGRISLPTANLESLILNSAGIVTVSSSVALDAISMNKPAIILGNPEYLNIESIREKVLIWRYPYKKEDVDNYILKFQPEYSSPINADLSEIYHPFSVESAGWLEVIIKDDSLHRGAL